MALRQQWQARPSQCIAELFGGMVVLLLFFAMLSVWVYFLALPDKPFRRSRTAEFERRLLEKVRAYQEHHR